MILTEPAVAFLPRSVPWGPTFTSTRDISKNAEPIPEGRGMYTPSKCVAAAGSPSSVLLELPIPRIHTSTLPWLLPISKPGIDSEISVISWIPCAFRSSPEKANAVPAKSWMSCDRRSTVTTMRSKSAFFSSSVFSASWASVDALPKTMEEAKMQRPNALIRFSAKTDVVFIGMSLKSRLKNFIFDLPIPRWRS